MYQFDDLSGQTKGIWRILSFSHMAHNGTNGRHYMSYYHCECKYCGKRALVARSQLTHSKCKCHKGGCEKPPAENSI